MFFFSFNDMYYSYHSPCDCYCSHHCYCHTTHVFLASFKISEIMALMLYALFFLFFWGGGVGVGVGVCSYFYPQVSCGRFIDRNVGESLKKK